MPKYQVLLCARRAVIIFPTLLFALKVSAEPTEAQRAFASASPSILVVRTFDPLGLPLKQGSAVWVAPSTAITNWHVVNRATEVRLIVKGVEKKSSVIKVDINRDLALISFSAESTNHPVRIASEIPAVGQAIYALGAPRGLELTLSPGIISAIRQEPSGSVIQFTAPISPGSSGGALLNSEGELVGITSFKVEGGENLNFAVPVAAASAMIKFGKSPPPREPEYGDPPLIGEFRVWEGSIIYAWLYKVLEVSQRAGLIRATIEDRVYFPPALARKKYGKEGDASVFGGKELLIRCDTNEVMELEDYGGGMNPHREITKSDVIPENLRYWSDKYHHPDIARFLCGLLDDPQLLDGPDAKIKHVIGLRKMPCRLLAADEFVTVDKERLAEIPEITADNILSLGIHLAGAGQMCISPADLPKNLQ